MTLPPAHVSPKGDANRKVALVTGASSGIGVETARGLLARGFHVVLSGRSAERTAKVADDLRRELPAEQLDYLLADFSSLAEVQRLAGEFSARFSRLDVLVNNAGLWHPRRTVSADGYEDTFAVNHLAPFLLTARLTPLLCETPGARVVTVSSRLHIKVPSFDFSDVMSERDYKGVYVYSKSKLANILFASELARRLKPAGVSSNSVHPGSVVTNVVRDSWLLSLGSRLPLPFLKSPEQGAQTSLYVATSAELAGVTGCYFASSQAHEPSRAARDVAAAKQLWQLSEELVAQALSAPV